MLPCFIFQFTEEEKEGGKVLQNEIERDIMQLKIPIDISDDDGRKLKQRISLHDWKKNK